MKGGARQDPGGGRPDLLSGTPFPRSGWGQSAFRSGGDHRSACVAIDRGGDWIHIPPVSVGPETEVEPVFSGPGK